MELLPFDCHPQRQMYNQSEIFDARDIWSGRPWFVAGEQCTRLNRAK